MQRAALTVLTVVLPTVVSLQWPHAPKGLLIALWLVSIVAFAVLAFEPTRRYIRKHVLRRPELPAAGKELSKAEITPSAQAPSLRVQLIRARAEGVRIRDSINSNPFGAHDEPRATAWDNKVQDLLEHSPRLLAHFVWESPISKLVGEFIESGPLDQHRAIARRLSQRVARLNEILRGDLGPLD